MFNFTVVHYNILYNLPRNYLTKKHIDMRHSVVNTKSKNLVRRMTYLYDNVKSNLNMAMTKLTNRILENNMYIATIAYTVQSSCGHRVLEKSVSHSLGLLVQSVWLLPNDSINKTFVLNNILP